MKQWTDLLKKIIVENSRKEGENTYVDFRTTRSGDCASVTGYLLEFDMREGFPIVTEKKVHYGSVVGELLWFLSGKTDLDSLRHYSDKPEDSWTIWSDDCSRWNKKKGFPEDRETLDNIYGRQWTDWGGKVNQIENLIKSIKEKPESRYHVVSAWNAGDIAEGVVALPACHTLFQCITTEDKYLDLIWYQRSGDAFLGIPYNISSYATLLHILAKLTGHKPRYLKGMIGDAHLYSEHLDQAVEVAQRKPFMLPQVVTPNVSSIQELVDKYTAKDFRLIDYANHGVVKAPLSVGD